MQAKKKIYDVVIVGAGVPGASVAAALVNRSCFCPSKVLMIDAAKHLPKIE